MIIPAVIEYQDLPGFHSPQTTNKSHNGSQAALFNMDDFLRLFNEVVRVMTAFYLDDGVINQLVFELINFTGVIAFNDLLQRKGFLSWKRGVQINYNITRIE